MVVFGANKKFASFGSSLIVTNVGNHIDGHSEDWLEQKEDDDLHHLSEAADLSLLLFIDNVAGIALSVWWSCCGLFDFIIILIAYGWVLQLLLVVIEWTSMSLGVSVLFWSKHLHNTSRLLLRSRIDWLFSFVWESFTLLIMSILSNGFPYANRDHAEQ